MYKETSWKLTCISFVSLDIICNELVMALGRYRGMLSVYEFINEFMYIQCFSALLMSSATVSVRVSSCCWLQWCCLCREILC